MLHILRYVALGMMLCGCGIARAAVDPAAVVDDVANTIAENYFDAEVGKRIATDLRARAADGAFDRHTDPVDLATALTEQLSPLDRHFRVVWQTPGSSTAPTGPTMIRRVPGTDPGGRPAFVPRGIRRVEVLPGGLGYLDLGGFDPIRFGQADDPARAAMDAALLLLQNTDAVIIDLRQNGGGAPQMVGYLASAFTPRGADIYNTFHHREGTSSEAPGDWYPKPRLETPLFVLISARTGSAAEAFAYTMQQAGRATIVGEASGGAANPGGSFNLADGFSVFVSTGSPINPISRKNWEGSGVIPDVAVPADDALPRAQILALTAVIERAGANDSIAAQWALAALKAGLKKSADIKIEEFQGSYGVMSIRPRQSQLVLAQGRRPVRGLVGLEHDLFAVREDPSLRVAFVRDEADRISALEIHSVDGSVRRFQRDAPVR